VDQLRRISAQADYCVCTGGLGPTVDDLTAEAVAQAFDMPLQLDQEALAAIGSWYERQSRPMPATNRKQALLPANARRLDNLWGTAPGFALEAGRCRFFFLPGVPAEMRGMFAQHIAPQLMAECDIQPRQRLVFHTFGMGESALQALMNRIALPPEVELGFCVVEAEVQVKLLLPADCAEAKRVGLRGEILQVLGDVVFSVEGQGEPGGGMAEVVGRLLDLRGATLALAETASKGRLAAICGRLDGLREARVYPTAPALLKALGLQQHRVGPEAAGLAARALQSLCGADYALAQLADEDETAPIFLGVFAPGLSSPEIITIARKVYRPELMAAYASLDSLRRYLLAIPDRR